MVAMARASIADSVSSIRAGRSAKVGRAYRLHVYIWQATTSDELSVNRACAVGSKSFSVRARR